MRGFPNRRLSLALAVLAALAASAAGAADKVALHDQPALHSSLATQALMLDVATAGERLVAVGERGFILLSSDQGATWQQVDSPVSVTLTRVRFANDNDGWAVGHAGVILHSADGGLSWTRQLDGVQAAQLVLDAAQAQGDETQIAEAQRLVDEGPDKPLLNLHVFDAQRSIVVGAYGLAFASDDGGQHWRAIGAALDNPSALHLYDLLAVGEQLFICGEQGLLLRSDDGGASFQALQSPASGTLFGMLATGPRSLLAFGLRGKAYRSDDLGATWQPLANRQTASFTAGSRLADGTLLLADESGSLQLSRDGGKTLQAHPLAQPASITGILPLPTGGLALSSTHGVLRIASEDLNRSRRLEQ